MGLNFGIDTPSFLGRKRGKRTVSTQTTESRMQIPLDFHTVVVANGFANHPDAPRFRHFEKRRG